MKQEIDLIHLQFGLRIRQLRTALGIDQLELSRRVGLTRTSIVNIESGKQRCLLCAVGKFAKAFGVSEKHLMKGIWF